MHLISKSSTSETGRERSEVSRPQRSGLRIAPVDAQPTGLFVAIEMAVLVFVAALAMVSIIVAGSEADGAERGASSAHVEHRDAGDPRAGKANVPAYRPVDRAREVDVASR